MILESGGGAAARALVAGTLLALSSSALAEDLRPPAAAPRSPELEQGLREKIRELGPSHEYRTRHLNDDGSPRYANRLLLEASPYLHQHAHNPVDWYPWGEEALARARAENRPVFLSIGYSTCHWCHVMEHESFDDEDVGRFLNEHFVAIKVDRERRPDVDHLYMTAVQLTGQRGGWPLSVFLTPEGEPFFGGTYMPRDPFLELLERVDQLWRERPEALRADAGRLARGLRNTLASEAAAREIGTGVFEQAVTQLMANYDSEYGGFSPAPKFPNEADLLLLLRSARRDGSRPEGSDRVFEAVEHTLLEMARGGIHDQIGGGFHRYSTDGRWRVPHFEKMLYTQAQLARVYLRAWQHRTPTRPQARELERAARGALDWVLREMTSPRGGFYSATDADSLDSQGRLEEGAFFVWSPDEVASVVTDPHERALIDRAYGVTAAGNFEGGRTVLHRPEAPEALAGALDLPVAESEARLTALAARLRIARMERSPPLRDDKILTAWNAMTITTLAEAAGLLGDTAGVEYGAAARRAAELLWTEHRRPDGRLWRISLDGHRSIDARLDDYAHLLEALLALYDLDDEPRWLERATSVADTLIEDFQDPDSGVLYLSPEHGDPLLLRAGGAPDQAVPAGSSVALLGLARLSVRTGDPRYRRSAQAALAAQSARIERLPNAFPYLLLGADELWRGEISSAPWLAGGKVRARGTRLGTDGGTEMRVELDIAEGWHVNSDRPLQEELIATHLGLHDESELETVHYPDAQLVTLGFQQSPLAVWSGQVTIEAAIHPAALPEHGAPIRLELRLQACDERLCLEPETVDLWLPRPSRIDP